MKALQGIQFKLTSWSIQLRITDNVIMTIVSQYSANEILKCTSFPQWTFKCSCISVYEDQRAKKYNKATFFSFHHFCIILWLKSYILMRNTRLKKRVISYIWWCL